MKLECICRSLAGQQY